MQANIGVVIVTFNRLEKLKKTLTCFKEQDLSPKYVLVVNNNSSDGTKEFLETWKKDDNCQFKKMVIHEKENLGGSGGFHVGLEKAKEMDAEWIWVSDDDAYPQKILSKWRTISLQIILTKNYSLYVHLYWIWTIILHMAIENESKMVF